MVRNLTVHEAMPGHVLQLALARRYRGATPIRQVLASGSFIEGWAVHAEEIMARLGYGGVPVRLQQLKMQLRTTINAMLDAGVHAGGMSETEALALMTDRGFQEEGEAVGKWRRALLTSAQLSTYFVGYLELTPTLAGRPGYDEVPRARQPAAAAPAGPARGRPGRRRFGNPAVAGVRRDGHAPPPRRRRPARRPAGRRLRAAGPMPVRSAARSRAPVPRRAAGAPTVLLQRFGGIAGSQDMVTVQPDGSWARTAKAGAERTGKLAADSADRLSRMAADPLLRPRPTRTVPESDCADAFDYALTVGATRIAWRDCGSATKLPRDCERHRPVTASKYQITAITLGGSWRHIVTHTASSGTRDDARPGRLPHCRHRIPRSSAERPSWLPGREYRSETCHHPGRGCRGCRRCVRRQSPPEQRRPHPHRAGSRPLDPRGERRRRARRRPPAQLHAAAGDSFVHRPVITSKQGLQYVPYERTYKGLRVYGGDFVVVTDKAGQVLSTAVGPGRADRR